jgi:hypothetical protein
MFKAKTKQNPNLIPKPIAGRERLHHFDSELAKATAAVKELEQRVLALEGIGVDAFNADRELQSYIQGEGGTEALMQHSAGHSKPDDRIAVLLATAKTTSEAAGPAKAALPFAQDNLEKCRAEVFRLEQERSEEIGRTMVRLVDDTAADYKRTFGKLCELHDQLAGFATVVSSNIGDVQLISEEIKTPRFALPSLASASEFDPFLRRRANPYAVEQSAKTWATVRQRLEADVGSDLSDIV